MYASPSAKLPAGERASFAGRCDAGYPVNALALAPVYHAEAPIFGEVLHVVRDQLETI